MSSISLSATPTRTALADFSRRHRIRRLALFGSALRFFAIQRELAELLGRAVDLNTPGFLSPTFREQVMAEAEELYVAP